MPLLQRAVLIVLIPLWAFAWLSTVRSLDRNAVVVPFYAAGAEAPDAFPVVTGFPSWTVAAPQPEPGIAIGDRVLAIAGTSVAGAGPERVASLAWAHMGNDARLDVEVEREGRRLAAQVAIPGSVPKWPVLPVSLVFGLMAVVGALGAAGRPALGVAWPAFLCTAFWLGAQFGETPGELLLAFWLRVGALLAIMPLYVRFVRDFPTDGDDGVRWARGWPWLLAINGLLVVDMELYGRLPAPVIDYVPKIGAVVFAGLILAIGTEKYSRARPLARRRLKWLFLGGWIIVVPPALVSALSAVRPELGRFFLLSQLAQLALPLSLWLGTGRRRLWRIDGILNAAVAWLGVAAAGLLVFVAGLEPVRDTLVSGIGLSPESAALAFALGLLALLLPLAIAVQSALDRVVFREQRARSTAIETLLPEIGRCSKLEEIAALLALRLSTIFGAPGAQVLADSGEGLLPVYATPGSTPPTPGEAAALASAAFPLELASGIGVPLRDAREGGALGAVVLGPKPAGDDYTPADRTLMAWVAERAAATARALREEERLSAARRMAAEVAAARDRAEDQSRDKTALLATASHDLRQPLHALGLLVDALEHRVSGEAARTLLRQVKSSAVSVEQRFNTLLDVARLESGALEPEMRDGVSLAPLFEELRTTVEALAEDKGLSLRVRPPRAAVRTDPVLLRSILENLLVNAVRHTKRGGVLLAARRRGEQIRVEVWDTGPGFRPQERERLFSAWERGDAGSEGAGLGLAIVRRLVDLLGHELELRSEPGRGSVFALSLPGSAASEPPRNDLSGLRAVLVDDEEDVRRATAACLASFGLDVVDGRDVAEVLAQVGDGPRPDVALLDLHLADGETGLDALATLESQLGPIPAAFVTGATGGAVVEAAGGSGRPVLRKPVAPVQLRAVLLHLLQSQDA